MASILMERDKEEESSDSSHGNNKDIPRLDSAADLRVAEIGENDFDALQREIRGGDRDPAMAQSVINRRTA